MTNKTFTKSFLRMAVLALLLLLLPVKSADAATVRQTLDASWVTTGNYSVRLAGSTLYYRVGTGSARVIAKNVSCASVDGATVVYIMTGKVTVEGYEEQIQVIKGFNLKTKKTTSYKKEADTGLVGSGIAKYGNYIYYSLFCGDCGCYHSSRVSMTTKKKVKNPMKGYTFYQKGDYLICRKSPYSSYNITETAKLRLYNVRTGSFVKTISTPCFRAFVEKGKLYYVRKYAVTDTTFKYVFVKSKLNGASATILGTIQGDYLDIVFNGKCAILKYWDDDYDFLYEKYSFADKNFAPIVESSFTAFGKYFEISNFGYYTE